MSLTERHAHYSGTAPSLRVTAMGYLHTEIDFAIGPRRIGEFGFVFLYSGEGWVEQAGRHHVLRGGELFLIYPNVLYAFAATAVRWQVYYANLISSGMAAFLGRCGVTPREYLAADVDREQIRKWWEEAIRQGQAKSGTDAGVVAARTWDMIGVLTSERRASPARSGSSLTAAFNHIDRHLTEEIPVRALAKLSHLSRFHFIRRFKRETGLSPRQYQINKRMTAARKLLAEGQPAKEVAQELGYRDLFYFSRLFKQKNGIPPSQYAAATSVVAKGQ